MQTYEVRAGDMIFTEGEKAKFACILRAGRVQILKHTPQGEVELAVLKAGEVFGEMALFEHSDKRSASARALEDVVVDVLSASEMQELLDQSPPLIQPFILALVKRLREMNRRLSEKERATVLLGNSINTIHFLPATSKMEGLMRQISVKSTNLPFTIGGYEASKPAPHARNLEIACDSSPINISYEHCAIERHDDGIYVVDYGSRFRTTVNDRSIGRGEATIKALLLPGDNRLILGKPTEEMELLLKCE
jgi:CRP-like cAMP-binding protein